MTILKTIYFHFVIRGDTIGRYTTHDEAITPRPGLVHKKKGASMKRISVIITLICIIPLTAVLASTASAELPGADTAALWAYITKVSPYTQWSFWPDHQGVQPGRAPHGRLHKVYVNDRALNSSRPPVQYGSIEVKENYDNSMNLKAITVMYKVHDYNPDDGDWFWVKYMPDGTAETSGKPDGCIGCHGTRANNDFILVHEFK